jgi:CRISPR system Cascade subunit CasD
MRHLILRLEAPLMSFGGDVIDANGPTLDFPLASLITGLLANALGWRRGQGTEHQRLQNRLIIGSRLDQPGERLVDFQTAQLGQKDRGWTTRGVIEGRDGGPDTYKSPHIRYRHYLADALVTVALRLEPTDEAPTLDDIAQALDFPARPLFIGRKACLPSSRIFAGMIDAEDVLAALKAWPLHAHASTDTIRICVPASEGNRPDHYRAEDTSDMRDWIAGTHAGKRQIHILAFGKADFQMAPT